MQPTWTARVAMACCGALFLAAAVSLTITPAVLALAALAYLLHARAAAAAAFDASAPRFSRRVLEPVLHEGTVFHLELDPSASALARGVAMSFRDQCPAGVRALAPPRGEGLATLRYAARPSAKGSLRFREVRVLLLDGTGLWRTTRRVPVATSVQVLTSLDALAAGRLLARRDPLDASARSPVGLLLREMEFESVRDFSPGDRLRDVDWKRVALHRRLLTRTWEKEMEATIAILVDAGRTMRARHGGVAKLDHVAALALEVAEAAAERSHRLGYLAFDELGVVDEMPPSRDRGTPRRLAQRLSDLPGRLLARRRLDVGLPDDAPLDEAETGFLAVLARLRGAPVAARPGVPAAVNRLLATAGADRLLVVAFTDLERVPVATLQGLGRVAAAGHRAVAVVLPGSRFHAPPDQPRLRDLENAYREEETRRRGRATLLARGVHVVELGPEESALPILRATREKEPAGRGAR